MLKYGILNPHVLSLLAHVRHTNTLVIADRGFPYWPQIETVDLSLVDDIPTVLQVFDAVRRNFSIGRIYMAEEFFANNNAEIQEKFKEALVKRDLVYESHIQLKQRIPSAVGLIRTGDTIQYANMILESV